jgi:hypothetical protein
LALKRQSQHDHIDAADGIAVEATLDLGRWSGLADSPGRSLRSRKVARSDPHSGACSRKPQGQPGSFRSGSSDDRDRHARDAFR